MIDRARVIDRYQRALDGIVFNQGVHTTEHPSHATWIHLPSLARWAYMSTCEFVKGFKEEVNHQSAKADMNDISDCSAYITSLLSEKNTHRVLLSQSGLANQDSLLAEALKA